MYEINPQSFKALLPEFKKASKSYYNGELERKNYKGISYDSKLSPAELKDKILPLLKNEKIFGLDLEACQLSDKVLENLSAMLQGSGSIRARIKEVLA